MDYLSVNKHVSKRRSIILRLMSEVTTVHNDIRSSFIDERCTQKAQSIHSLIESSTQQMINRDNKQENRISSTINKNSFPFGQCRICMHNATGFHYGVQACEGCKAFYKRSLIRKEEYRCRFGDQCQIDKNIRNLCKACRFKKCLDKGMSVNAIRMGRIPKAVKEQALTKQLLSCPNTENAGVDSSSSSTEILTHYLFLNESHHDKDSMELNCSINIIEYMKILLPKLFYPIETSELNNEEFRFIRNLRLKILQLSNKYNQQTRQYIGKTQSIINDQIEYSTLQNISEGLSDTIPFHVKNLIEFAYQTPAINEINSNDFHKIMNNRLFDFWMIKHAPLIYNNESYIILPNGLQYTRQWMIRVLGEEIVQTIFDFANKYNQLNLTEEEQGLILPVIICNNDQTLDDQETIKNIQYFYLYVLSTQMLLTRTSSETKTIIQTVVQILQHLTCLNKLQEETIEESMESES